MFNTLFSKYVLLPIGKTYSGRKYLKSLKYQCHLEETQYWDRSKLDSLRDSQFRSLVSHCYHNVPFYSDYMLSNNLSPHDFKTVSDIVKLPILTKKDINENFLRLLASNYDNRFFRYSFTGGTTGRPTKFVRDAANEYKVDANNWRLWKLAGYKKGMKTAMFWGNPTDLLNSNKVKQALKGIMENTVTYNFYGFSKKSLSEYAKHIQKIKPQIIRGYATAIYLFVEHCRERNIHFHRPPKAIILTSEKIYPPQKITIRDFFGCDVFEEYGSREFSLMAHECKSHEGLHLAEDLFIFEIFNNRLNESTFNGQGQILVTPFFNYAMPLLRYAIEDEGNISRNHCSCGRTLRLLSHIEGRLADYIVTKTKRFIRGGIFNSILSAKNTITLYQVHQTKKGEAIIYLVPNQYFRNDELKTLQKTFNPVCQDDLTILFKLVSSIPVTISGKRRTIYSEIASRYLPL